MPWARSPLWPTVFICSSASNILGMLLMTSGRLMLARQRRAESGGGSICDQGTPAPHHILPFRAFILIFDQLTNQTHIDSRYSYGWHRAEILAALVNGVFLLALCFSISLEAIGRFFSTPGM